MKVLLPPSWRDFEAYRLVKVEQQSTRQAAKTLGISQTRICQVIERVAAYLVQMAPATREEERREQRLHVAEQMAAERINFLYSQSVDGWRESQRPTKTIREANLFAGKTSVTTIRSSCGDPRYLMLACRLAEHAAMLPQPTLFSSLAAAALEAEEAECERENVGRQPAVLRAVPARKQQDPATRPLDGDCSELFAPSAEEAEFQAKYQSASNAADLDSALDSLRKVADKIGSRRAVQQAVQPVQRADRGEGDSSLGPAEYGFSLSHPDERAGLSDPRVRRPLNRKERKARQAMLEKKLRKAK
jgi:hypothetical protein